MLAGAALSPRTQREKDIAESMEDAKAYVSSLKRAAERQVKEGAAAPPPSSPEWVASVSFECLRSNGQCHGCRVLSSPAAPLRRSRGPDPRACGGSMPLRSAMCWV